MRRTILSLGDISPTTGASLSDPAAVGDRVAQLDDDLAAAPYEELSKEEIADRYKITLNEASTLMSEYERLHPGSKGIPHIRYVRRARRGDARRWARAPDRDARKGRRAPARESAKR